jgi:putative transposase
MPRAARKAPGGQVYHVLNRSVGKMRLFALDADFEEFQRVLIEAHRRHPIRILSYCILSNHWHFVVRGLPSDRWRGDGLLPLAGAHPCDALEGRPQDGGLRASVSGAILPTPAEIPHVIVGEWSRRRSHCQAYACRKVAHSCRSPAGSCDSVGLANPHRPCDPGTRGHPTLARRVPALNEASRRGTPQALCAPAGT